MLAFSAGVGNSSLTGAAGARNPGAGALARSGAAPACRAAGLGVCGLPGPFARKISGSARWIRSGSTYSATSPSRRPWTTAPPAGHCGDQNNDDYMNSDGAQERAGPGTRPPVRLLKGIPGSDGTGDSLVWTVIRNFMQSPYRETGRKTVLLSFPLTRIRTATDVESGKLSAT